jgi:muramoyltetrapeptide carboxypeptidase
MAKDWARGEGLSPFSERYFWHAFRPSSPLFEDWGGVGGSGVARPSVLVGGTAEGRLAGGNLSVICALMGTRYEIDTQGAILFLEDVGEKLFRIDRMLNQLRLAGKLGQARGLLLGRFAGCEQRDGDVTRKEVFADYLSALGVPVLLGFPAGHVSDHATLPLGVRVRLNADTRTVTLLEAAVGG